MKKCCISNSFSLEVMVNKDENGLKGQYNLAQGKRSVALGWRKGINVVRAINSIKEKFLFRTKQRISCSREMIYCNSVRNKCIALINIFARMGFLLYSFPRATFRFVPPSTLPWADISWPFRPKLGMMSDYFIER